MATSPGDGAFGAPVGVACRMTRHLLLRMDDRSTGDHLREAV